VKKESGPTPGMEHTMGVQKDLTFGYESNPKAKADVADVTAMVKNIGHPECGTLQLDYEDIFVDGEWNVDKDVLVV